jgi:hypothetical protein
MTLNIHKGTTSELVRTGKMLVSSVILVAGADNASVVLSNSIAGASDNRIALKALANTSTEITFDGLVEFPDYLYSALTGTSPVVYIYHN